MANTQIVKIYRISKTGAVIRDKMSLNAFETQLAVGGPWRLDNGIESDSIEVEKIEVKKIEAETIIKPISQVVAETKAAAEPIIEAVEIPELNSIPEVEAVPTAEAVAPVKRRGGFQKKGAK